MKFLIDSVIIIDHLNGRPGASVFLERYWEECAISVITRAETLVGADTESTGTVRTLLDRFPALPVEMVTGDLAADLRRQHKWKLSDAIQAALAILHGLKFVTRNVHDFNPRRHSFVLIPYR